MGKITARIENIMCNGGSIIRVSTDRMIIGGGLPTFLAPDFGVRPQDDPYGVLAAVAHRARVADSGVTRLTSSSSHALDVWFSSAITAEKAAETVRAALRTRGDVVIL